MAEDERAILIGIAKALTGLVEPLTELTALLDRLEAPDVKDNLTPSQESFPTVVYADIDGEWELKRVFEWKGWNPVIVHKGRFEYMDTLSWKYAHTEYSHNDLSAPMPMIVEALLPVEGVQTWVLKNVIRWDKGMPVVKHNDELVKVPAASWRTVVEGGTC
jgi:hypothetical protein